MRLIIVTGSNGMRFCPQCGYHAAAPGDCPTCTIASAPVPTTTHQSYLIGALDVLRWAASDGLPASLAATQVRALVELLDGHPLTCER